jgi:sigma-B regulation protein RsbU (phosphoserine phosphatase)
MLREVIETTSLEDFVYGLARVAGRRVCVYDDHGDLILASPADNDFAQLTRHVLTQLPGDMRLVPVPAHDPPASVAFVVSHGVWYIVAPIQHENRHVGFVAVGEFRDTPPDPDEWNVASTAIQVEFDTIQRAWESLPQLDRGLRSHAVITARWGARQIAEWSRRESHLLTLTDEMALVGDIAELLAGEGDLQRVLDRIVQSTARVMKCPFASMRLYDPKSNELRIQAVHGLSQQYVGKGAIVRTAGAVSDEALRGAVVYVEDVATDPRVLHPDEARQEGIVSMLTAGMLYRDQPIGVLRVYTGRKRRFRKAQRDLLHAVACQAATAIVQARLAEDRLRNAETQRQLALAGDLQRRTMRLPPPPHPQIESALAFHPTYKVAGDFCDLLELADGRLAALVGDVVGKGIPASLLMSSVHGAIRAHAERCTSPGELLTRLNAQVCRETRPEEFLTMLLIAIDADARRVTYAGAGHEPLLTLRDGDILETEPAGLVLGLDPTEVYEDHQAELRPDDLLLLYTDGAIEALNFDDEAYGRTRLHESLRTHGDLAVSQVLRSIVWDIRRFVGLAEQSDDLTLVGLRVRP